MRDNGSTVKSGQQARRDEERRGIARSSFNPSFLRATEFGGGCRPPGLQKLIQAAARLSTGQLGRADSSLLEEAPTGGEDRLDPHRTPYGGPESMEEDCQREDGSSGEMGGKQGPQLAGSGNGEKCG